jgi:outer membrane protein assembly factor BamB
VKSKKGFAMTINSLVTRLSSALVSTVVALAALSLHAAPQPEKHADWPLFRGNALQTGVAGSALPDKLEILWKFETGDRVEGTAAIANGVVYVGALDEHLYAINLATGKKDWEYEAGPIASPASVHDGKVYIDDNDGKFQCIDAKTGKQVWIFETGRDIKSGANFAGDSILLGSGDGHLYCLSKEGKELWKFQVAGGPVLGTPVVLDDRTFAAGCDSTLHVLDLANGKELATLELGGQIGAAAAVMGDQFYVGTMTNQVLGIDWKKPEVKWTFESADQPEPFFASAAVTNKLLITSSRDRHVYALDRSTGTEVWNFPTGGKVDSSPVVAGERVYVGSSDGKLYVLNLEDGKLVQKIDLGGPISASPAVGGGCLVIGTERNAVFCLGAKK